MNTKSSILVLWLCVIGIVRGSAQGLLVDQSAGTIPTGTGVIIQTNGPLGQSFTPSMSGIGFVQLAFWDNNPGNGTGAMVYVNLRSDSMTGVVLGSTDPVFMPNNFGGLGVGITNFFFASPVTLTPGTQYFMEVIASGDLWNISGYHWTYSGGTQIYQGTAVPGQNLWFTEGIIVPEPSTMWLLAVGGGVLFYVRRRHMV